MATTPTKTYSANEQLPASVAGPIQQSISAIQKSISGLSSGSSQSTPSQGGAVVGGRIVGAGGKDLGAANPADVSYARPSNDLTDHRNAQGEQVLDAGQIDPTTGQKLAENTPDALAPANQLAPINQPPAGVTLKKTAQGTYSAMPDESALRAQAHQALTASGQPASQSAGIGSATAQAALKGLSPNSDSPSILGGMQETDNNFDSLFTEYDKYFSPQVQKTSLVDEYNKMSKSLGIDSINAELINDKKIIDGTEDDIRNEITAAGGFASDSQVLAMANARNKSLIKNYNYLLDTKNAATTQLNTMMQLSVQDRQFAEAEFDRKMNYTFKVAEFQQKAQENARSQYMTLITNGFGASLAADPHQTSLVEKTLGLPSGGLTTLVKQQQAKADLEQQLTQAKINAENRSNQGGTVPTIKSINGVDKQWNPTTKTWEDASMGATPTEGSNLKLAKTKGEIDQIDEVIKDKNIRSAVGPNLLSRLTSRGLDSLTGGRQNYISNVEQIRSQLTLDSLINAKAQGATFGALSEGELGLLSKSGTKLSNAVITNKSGQVTGYKLSEKDMKNELDKINYYKKLDYVKKGGDPTELGAQLMDDGHYYVKNADDSYSMLK